MYRTRNAAYGQPYRGFESLPLRQLPTKAQKPNRIRTSRDPSFSCVPPHNSPRAARAIMVGDRGYCREGLRDRSDLKVLIRCADFIPNGLAHQNPRHRGYEGNRTGLRVRFVLSHDTKFLYAPIAAPEGHRAPKGHSFG